MSFVKLQQKKCKVCNSNSPSSSNKLVTNRLRFQFQGKFAFTQTPWDKFCMRKSVEGKIQTDYRHSLSILPYLDFMCMFGGRSLGQREKKLFYFFPCILFIKILISSSSIVPHPDNCTEGKCHNRHMPAVPSNPANYCFPTWKYSIYPFPGEITYSAARQ